MFSQYSIFSFLLASLILSSSLLVHGLVPYNVAPSTVSSQSTQVNNNQLDDVTAQHISPDSTNDSPNRLKHQRRNTAHLSARCSCSSRRRSCKHNKKSKSAAVKVGNVHAVVSTNKSDKEVATVAEAPTANNDAGVVAAVNTTPSQDQAQKAPEPEPASQPIQVGIDTKVEAVVSTHQPSNPQGQKVGDATYYATGLGACGQTSADTSMIAAASHLLFDTFPGATANPNNNPICGRKVRATYQGKSVEVQIVDRCEGCAMDDLDFSPSAFQRIGATEVGRLHGMTWEWI